MAGKKTTVMLEMLGDNADLRKKLSDSERRLKRFEAQAKRSGRGAAGMNKGFGTAGKGLKGMIGPTVGAAAGLMTLNGALDFAKGSVGAYTDLAKSSMALSRATGFDIETASEWISLTKARGISAQKLTVSFNTLAKKIQDAGTGGKKSAELFSELGVSMADVSAGNTSAVISQVADSFAKMKDGPQKTALALKLFGRQGATMIPILNKGSGALREQLAEMKKLGASVGGKGAEDVANYAKNQRTLKTAIEGVKISLGAALVPALAKASQGLVRFVTQAREGKGTGGALKSILVSVGGALVSFAKSVAPAVRALGKFAGQHPGLMKFLVIGGVITKLGLNFFGFAKRLLPVISVLMRVGKVFFAFLKLLRLAPMMAGPIGILISVLVLAAVMIITHWKTVRGWLSTIWNGIVRLFRRGAGIVVNLAKKGFLGPVPWIISHWRGVVSFFSGLIGTIGRIAKSIARSLWGGIKNGAGAIVGTVKSVINGMIGFLERGVNRMIDGINKAIDLANKLPGVDIGHIGHISIPRLAAGGIIAKPTFAMVGEAGPEAVIPLSASKRRRGTDLLNAAAAALGVAPQASAAGHGIALTVNNYGDQMNESVIATRLAWQLQTRGI